MTMKMTMMMTKARDVEVGGDIKPQYPMAIMPQPSLRPQQSSTSLSLKEVPHRLSYDTEVEAQKMKMEDEDEGRHGQRPDLVEFAW
jgi:hypothetical protein